ncbi:MAG: FxLYD domain-containing protein [Chthonomonadales bacterium]
MAATSTIQAVCRGRESRCFVWRRWAVAGAVLGTCVVPYAMRGSAESGPLQRLRAPVPARAAVMLLSATASRDAGYVTVAGEVRNASRRNLAGAEVVLELFDGNGRCIAVEPAILARAVVPPGTASSFQVTAEDWGKAQRYRLEFREIDGAVLECLDNAQNGPVTRCPAQECAGANR